MRSALLRRGASLTAASALAITTLGALAGPAEAHPAGDRAVTAGATWLTSQLTNGLVEGAYGTDYGLSVDFGLALKAAGNPDAVTTIASALAPKVANYISGDAFGDVGSTYAGSTAKAAAFAQAAGRDPRAFGGLDLVARSEGTVSSTAPIVGRIQDVSAYGDYANVIGQSFAARALTTAGSAKAADVTGFLLQQQCPEGFFRANLTADKTTAQQGCVTGATGSEPSVDTTALTAINLLDTPGASPAAKDAAAKGIAWLKTQQQADGSFGTETEGFNANSTGLAGWALTKAGATTEAAKAASWLRGVQVADIAPCAQTKLSADNGALAFKPKTLADARAAGIVPAQRDQYRRATAQALPALANVPAGAGPLAISAPATAVEKSTVTVTVAGLGAGEAACVSLGTEAKAVTGTGGDVRVTFALPAGAAAHTFTLTTLAGAATAVTSSTLTPAPVPPATPATPELGTLKARKVVTAKKGRFTLKVACRDTEACTGKVVVRTAGRTKERKIVVAKKGYSVAPGASAKVTLKMTKRARATLSHRGRTKVAATQHAPELRPATTKFWLRVK